MGLRDKFEHHSHWRHFEQERTKNPDAVFAALILTSEPVTLWPEGVTKSTHIPHHNGKDHLYTIRAKGEAFEDFCNQPIVKRLTL